MTICNNMKCINFKVYANLSYPKSAKKTKVSLQNTMKRILCLESLHENKENDC